MLILLYCRHKTRVHIGQLVKDTSAKLKQASETDHHADVSVSFLRDRYFCSPSFVGIDGSALSHYAYLSTY